MTPRALFEKYRPQKWEEVLGQDKTVAKLKVIGRNGWIGKRVWLSGPSGTGKSTIANIIANEATTQPNTDIRQIVGRELTPAALREIMQAWQYRPWGGCHVLIIDEAHGISKATMEMMLGAMEELLAKGRVDACVICTTTWEGEATLFEEKQDSNAFASRCAQVRLTNQGLAQVFAERALEIARTEGLDGQPIEKYVKLVQRVKNNMRAALEAIDAGEMVEA
jgi:replication-associated recombination protein RarA